MISRRTFITTGILGAAALATAHWLRGPHAPPGDAALRVLDADAQAISAPSSRCCWPARFPTRPARDARRSPTTVRGIDTAISGLPPSAQDELRQLFALLSLPPARLAIARVSEPWNRASEAEVRACLDRFRGSSLPLLRSAYGACTN